MHYKRRKISKALRRDIIGDSPSCFWCHTTRGPWDIDHYVPVSKGGSNAAGNLRVACKPCNNKRGNMDALQFARIVAQRGWANVH